MNQNAVESMNRTKNRKGKNKNIEQEHEEQNHKLMIWILEDNMR